MKLFICLTSILSTVLIEVAGFGFVPKVSLLLIMGVAMLLDFITGVIKSVYIKRSRTSKRYRETFSKFLQYGGAILIGMGISYMAMEVGKFNETWKYAPELMSWFNNALIVYAIFCEIVSIAENLVAINPSSTYAKYVIGPALRIITLELKKGPYSRITLETDNQEIDKDKVDVQVLITPTVPGKGAPGANDSQNFQDPELQK